MKIIDVYDMTFVTEPHHATRRRRAHCSFSICFIRRG